MKTLLLIIDANLGQARAYIWRDHWAQRRESKTKSSTIQTTLKWRLFSGDSIE